MFDFDLSRYDDDPRNMFAADGRAFRQVTFTRTIKIWCGSPECMFVDKQGRRRPSKREIGRILLTRLTEDDGLVRGEQVNYYPHNRLVWVHSDNKFNGDVSCKYCHRRATFREEDIVLMGLFFWGRDNKQTSLSFLVRQFNGRDMAPPF